MSTTSLLPSHRLPRFGILTCMWQRPALTRLVLKSYAAWKSRFAGVVEFELMCVGSEGERSKELAERAGWSYLEHPNLPLGAKWNAGLKALSKKSIDALIIVGSDDVMSENVVPFYLERLAEGEHAVGFSDMYAIDLGSLEGLYWKGYTEDSPRFGETIGLGRCLSANLLNRVSWRLWKDELNKTLDLSMTRNLLELTQPQKIRSYIAREYKITLVDIKSNVNLNTLHAFTRTPNFEHLQKPDEINKILLSTGIQIGSLLRLSSCGNLLPSIIQSDLKKTRLNIKQLIQAKDWASCYVVLKRLIEIGQYDYIDLRNFCIASININADTYIHALLNRLYFETELTPQKNPVCHNDILALMIIVNSKFFNLELVTKLYERLSSRMEISPTSEPFTSMQEMVDSINKNTNQHQS